MMVTNCVATKSFTHKNKIMSPLAVHLSSRVVLVLVLCILLVKSNASAETGRRNKVSHQKTEVQNKPIVKSIKSPDGDIIDCVHIAHQPAFNHPSLKNHTIQMRPNYQPNDVFVANKAQSKGSKLIAQLWHSHGRCPKATVPIRRSKRNHIHRASSVETFRERTMDSNSIPEPSSNPLKPPTLRHSEYAIAYVDGEQYYGASATINVWKPKVVFPDEYSSAQILMQGGSYEELNIIKAGWQVFPDLYDDVNSRLFIYWTDNIYNNTECFNLHCPGFVQVSREIALGASVPSASTYGGGQSEIFIHIKRDNITGNWWLIFGTKETELHEVGYWVADSFPKLADGASMVQWGGEVVNSRRNGEHTTTQMGSGRFSAEGFGNSSYFWDARIVNISSVSTLPKTLKNFTTNFNCYDIKTSMFNDWGYFFLYGGPGYNTNCN